MRRWLLFCGLIVCLNMGGTPALANVSEEKERRVVRIALFINDISKFDVRAETIQFEASVFLSWVDPTQKVSQIQYFPGMMAVKKLQTMWWPYLKLLQSRGERVTEARTLTISPGGVVRYQERFSLVVETNLDMKHFPFDEQRISLSVAPFGPSKYHIDLQPDPKYQGIGRNANLDEWAISKLEYSIQDKANEYGRIQPQYILSMGYQRHASFYVVKIFIPLLVIVILSWSVLWLLNQPVINLISVVLVALLTVVAFQWAVMDKVPKVPYLMYFEAVLLFVYITVGSIVVFLTLFANVSQERAEHIAFHLRYLYPMIFLLGLLLISAVYFL